MSENGAQPDETTPVEIQVPQLTIPLNGAMVHIERRPDSDERVMVVGPIAVAFVLPLSGEAARQISTELMGGIEIASGLDQAARRAAEHGNPSP